MIIIHRCGNCGHDMRHHWDKVRGRIPCLSGCHGCSGAEQTASELTPTFALSGKMVERIIKPGDAIGSVGMYASDVTCDCDDCKALYVESVG